VRKYFYVYAFNLKNFSTFCVGVSIEIIIPANAGIQMQNFGF